MAFGDAVQQMRLEAGEERSERLQQRDRAFVVAWTSGVATGAVGIILTLVISALLRKTALAQKARAVAEGGPTGLGSAVSGEQPLLS